MPRHPQLLKRGGQTVDPSRGLILTEQASHLPWFGLQLSHYTTNTVVVPYSIGYDVRRADLRSFTYDFIFSRGHSTGRGDHVDMPIARTLDKSQDKGGRHHVCREAVFWFVPCIEYQSNLQLCLFRRIVDSKL